MDWINCNTCCRQPGDEKERIFMLSSCGHIFCDLCLAQESRNKCKVCSAQCQLIQLSSKMNPDAEMYFQEPAELIKKQNMQLSRLLDFQKEHRFRLVSFHRKTLLKYKELERKFRMAADRIQYLEKENSKLKEMVNLRTGGEGRRDFGAMGGVDNLHNSYQKAISASGVRCSPQEKIAHHTSPSGSQVSPGRLTLLKCKTPLTSNIRDSSNSSPNDTRLKTSYCTTVKGSSPYYPHLTPGFDPSIGMMMYPTEMSRGSLSTLKGVGNETQYARGGMALSQIPLPQQLHAQFQSKKNFAPNMQGIQLG